MTAAYASSKAAVRNHTTSVALYCTDAGLGAPLQLRAPAAVRSRMWDAVLGHGPDPQERLEELAAVHRSVASAPRGGGGGIGPSLLTLELHDPQGLHVDGGVLAGSPITSRTEPGGPDARLDQHDGVRLLDLGDDDNRGMAARHGCSTWLLDMAAEANVDVVVVVRCAGRHSTTTPRRLLPAWPLS